MQPSGVTAFLAAVADEDVRRRLRHTQILLLFGKELSARRQCIPFLERNEQYCERRRTTAPPSASSKRLRGGGASFLAFGATASRPGFAARCGTSVLPSMILRRNCED